MIHCRLYNVRTVFGRVLLICGLLLFAFLLRSTTFTIPHILGDELHYLGLAVKLDALGMDHFNLRGIKFNFINLDDGKVKLVYFTPMDDPQATGDILAVFIRAGVYYYDLPLFHKPPGFPYALILGHKLFGTKDQPYIVVAQILRGATRMPRAQIVMDPIFYRKGVPFLFKTQAHLVMVPLIFSLGLILCTFLLGRELFSYRVGWYAALLVAVHPVSLVTAQKLFADDMLSFFTSLALLLYVIALRREYIWLSLTAGIACGFGVLAKQTAGYMFIALGVFSLLQWYGAGYQGSDRWKKLCNRYFLSFAVGIFTVSGWWFLKVYMTYGSPIYLPEQSSLAETNVSGWFKMLRSRPPGWILYTVGIPYLSPLLFAWYASVKDCFIAFRQVLKRRAYNYRYLLLWVVILTFMVLLRNGSEHRRMLPVYPAITILAAVYLEKWRTTPARWARWCGNVAIRSWVLVFCFILSSGWSIVIGLKTVLAERQLIRIPF